MAGTKHARALGIVLLHVIFLLLTLPCPVIEEHHIKDWDAKSFFALHDYNSDGSWQVDEVMRTYGLMDDSHKDTPQDKKIEIARKVMELIDSDGDGLISRAEWDDYIDAGETLPDMGTGPGHHGDDEYEYEIHHWEK